MTGTHRELRLPDGRAVWCTSPGEASLMWREATGDGFYRHAAQLLRPGDTVLDVGANVGLVSMAFADAQPRLRVIAVEPVPDTFACLEANLARWVPGAVAIRTAVAAVPGQRSLTYYPAAPGNSGLYADRLADDAMTRTYMRNSGMDDEFIELLVEGLHEGRELPVPVTTVSELMRAYDVGTVALLKVDVERAEMDVLRGVAGADWARIDAVVAEVHDEDGRLADFCALLREAGLPAQVRQDPGLVGTGLFEILAHREAGR
ncbi:FkbM family methyltransferase [Actinoplanes sp. NPDC051851]|uniref:FkbM family methyltransferase n=1 Tax=Actinoplanes sp. NPDC051851 TaxID=3154753 RepID=UPI00343BE0AD